MAEELIVHASLTGTDNVIKGMTEMDTSTKVLSKSINDFSTGLTTRTASAFTSFKSRLTDLGTATEGLRTRIESLSNTIGKGLVSGMKLATVGMIGLVAATGSMAYETEKNYAQFKNVLTNFSGGNASLTNQLYNQAKQYNDIVSISGQESGLKQLLVNPAFRSQAGAANAAILKISAASGNQANSVYSMLTSAIGRIEDRQRMDPRTLLMLQKAGVNINPFIQQVTGISPSANSPLTMEAAQKLIQEIGTPQQMLNFLQTTASQPGMAGAIQRQRETPTGAVAYLKAQVENAIDNASGAFDKAISTAIGPVTKMIAGKGGLIQTLAPPLLNFVGSLAKGLSSLIPFFQGPLKALATFFSRAIVAIIPAFQRMQPIGRALGTAFYKFLAAFIPVMPALVNALVTFMQVLPAITPPLVTTAQVFAKLLVTVLDFVNGIGKIMNQSGAMKVIGESIGGVVAALIALKGIGTVINGIKAVWGFFGDLEKAGKGLWNFLFGGGKGALGTLGTAENPMYTRQVGGCNCGGGGGGAPTPCSEMCDDTGNVGVLAKGVDAGLTTSAAGTPMVMSQVLKYGGLTAAGVGLIAEVAGGQNSLLYRALKQYLDGSSTPETTTTTTTTTHTTDSGTTHTSTTTTHGKGTGHAGTHGTHTSIPRLPYPALPGASKKTSPQEPSTIPAAATAPAGGYVLTPAAQKIVASGSELPGKGGWETTITHVATAVAKSFQSPLAKEFGNSIGALANLMIGAGGKPSKVISDIHTLFKPSNATVAAGATGLAGILAKAGITNASQSKAIEAEIETLQRAMNADEGLADVIDMFTGGVAAAQGLTKKQRAQQIMPKVPYTSLDNGTSTGEPTTVTFNVQQLHVHGVKDLATFEAHLKELARKKMVGGARKPNSWASPAYGHTNVLQPGS